MKGSAQSLLDVLTVVAGAAIVLGFIALYWRNSTVLKGCLLTFTLAAGLLSAGMLGVLDVMEDGSGSPVGMVFALTAARIALLFTALVLGSAALTLLIVPKLRPIGQILLQRLLRWPEARDFSAARKASGHEGTVLREPGLNVWTDIEPMRHATFAATLERTVRATAGATGLRLDKLPALRVLAFNNSVGFDAYGGRLGQIFARAGGYSIRWPRPVVVVHREIVEILRPNLDWVLAHEYVHYLTHGAMGPIREIWLSEGLAMYLPSLALDTHPRSVRPTRILQASIQRGDMPPPKTFLKANHLRMRGLDEQSAKGETRSEAAGQITLYYFMSGAFVRYLHRRDAAAFQRFLGRYRRAGASARHFKSCFGVSPAQALQDHIDHVLASEAPPIRLPLPEERVRIDTEIIAPLQHPSTALDRRLELLGTYGLIASAWRVDAVIDQYEAAETGHFLAGRTERTIPPDDRALIASVTQRTLENLAGGRVAEDAAGWREWAEGLPRELLSPVSGA
jgi:hypothetical protein